LAIVKPMWTSNSPATWNATSQFTYLEST
jgi:hypothetical protein